ncbi:MAG: hypothetical protein KDA65_08835 [Planctomycetaceae bacterium]|nr:hypothetical protein [Planctomycetaceae bacterium]
MRAPIRIKSGTAPAGTTLVEVLLSILLMGIGLVALATLFPASILRTVRAHHLTTATNLRFNAETILDMYPTYVDEWDNGATYPEAVPSPGVTGYIVVDPQGYVDANQIGGNPDYFGDNNVIRRQMFDTTTALLNLDKDGGAANDRDDAVLFTTSADGWDTIFDATVVDGSETATTVQVDTEINIDESIVTTALPSYLVYRIILFGDQGSEAEYRYISGRSDATKTITWTGDVTGITAGTFAPERVRVEISDPRLSWLMTVRRSYIDGTQVSNNADVVVFFNRHFETDSETVYTGSTMTIGSSNVRINASNIDPEPKVGNFIFDAEKCHWYKIVSVEATNPYDVTIDRPAVKSSGSLMLVRNVVDVFPLKTFVTD